MLEAAMTLSPVPLESTLPGWPQTDNPPMAIMILLMVAIPVALAALFVLGGMSGKWRAERADSGAAEPGAALPAGAHAPRRALGADATQPADLPPGSAAHAADRPVAP